MRLNRISRRPQLQKVADALIRALSLPSNTGVHAEDRDIAKSRTEPIWAGQHPASPKFFAWLRQNGVEAVPGQLPQYAEGGDGRAYFLGRHVVKFTRDRAGANIANMCVGVRGAPAPVIAVWRVPAVPLWAILQWRVQPERVPGDIKAAADYLTAWLDENPGMEEFPTARPDQEKEAARLLAALGGPAALVPSVVMMMDVHNRLFRHTGFAHSDGGPTNISMRDDEVVYHDLGPNMGKDYRAREVLDRVHANRKKLNLPDVEEV